MDESYIKAKVEDGFYSNATELVRDAVRRLREADDQRYDRLIAALEVGEKALRDGRVVPYTPKFLDECADEARKMVEKGIAPDPDVCP